MPDRRQCILLRHGHAEPAVPGQPDLDRPLTRDGELEASAAGRWLASHAFKPARVLTSPATRADATARAACAELGDTGMEIGIESDAAIYEATPGALFDVIERHQDAGPLLVVGHNPGMEQLLGLLTDGRTEDVRGMPTAGIAWLDWPEGAPLEPGAARLRAFWSP